MNELRREKSKLKMENDDLESENAKLKARVAELEGTLSGVRHQVVLQMNRVKVAEARVWQGLSPWFALVQELVDSVRAFAGTKFDRTMTEREHIRLREALVLFDAQSLAKSEEGSDAD